MKTPEQLAEGRAEAEAEVKQYTQRIGDTHVHVDQYGCVHLRQDDDVEDTEYPDLVHICSDEWAKVVAAANELIYKRGSDNPTERVAEWYENAARLAEEARAQGAHTFMALCPNGHVRDLLERHQETNGE